MFEIVEQPFASVASKSVRWESLLEGGTQIVPLRLIGSTCFIILLLILIVLLYCVSVCCSDFLRANYVFGIKI